MWHIFFSQDVSVVQNLPIDCTLNININIINSFFFNFKTDFVKIQ